MKYIQFTEKGSRMNNEDSLNIIEIADKRTLFVVCDGMDGHSFGEVASQTVCDSLSKFWRLQKLQVERYPNLHIHRYKF